jgi:hypothetical protein
MTYKHRISKMVLKPLSGQHLYKQITLWIFCQIVSISLFILYGRPLCWNETLHKFYYLFSAVFTINVCGLFNDAVSSSECVVPIGGFIIEKLYYRIICLEGLRKTAKKACKFSRSPDRGLNSGLLEYEVGVLVFSKTTYDFMVYFPY